MAATTEPQPSARLWLATVALLSGTPAAAQSAFSPFLLVSETYTSNVTLAEEGLEESAWVTTLSPGFGLTSRGSKHDFELAYQMQHLVYADASERNETFNQADVITNLDLWPDRFGIDFLGAYAQTILDPTLPIPLSNVASTANRLDFGTANLNPYFTFNLGAPARVRIDYADGIVNYHDVEPGTLVDDVRRKLGSVAFGSAEQQRFRWELSYSKQRAEFDLFPEFRYERAALELGIPIGADLFLVAISGKETDVPVSRTIGGLDSRFWEGGFRWEPSRRAAIELRTGERFFGDTHYGEISVNGDRLSILVNYREDPTTLGLEQLGRPVINLQPGDTGFTAGQLTQELFINRELAGEVRYDRSRTEAVLSVRDIEREYIDTAEKEAELQIDMDWYWRFGSRSTLGFGLFFADIEFRTGGTEDRLRQISVSYDRETGSRSRLSFAVRRERRGSTAASSLEYEENAAVIEYALGAAPRGRRF